MQHSPKSLLDIALENYDIQATRHFAEVCAAENSPPDLREERQKALEKAKRHLDSQRMNAEAVASIQAKLDAYREEGRDLINVRGAAGKTALNALEAEAHHRGNKLGQYMIAEGRPKPSSEHAAHHIVPGKGRLPQTNLARTHLHILGIRINDPDNGAWLPLHKKHTPHWSMPEAKAHLEYHTKSYEMQVSARVRRKRTEAEIRFELRLICKQLECNQFPV